MSYDQRMQNIRQRAIKRAVDRKEDRDVETAIDFVIGLTKASVFIVAVLLLPIACRVLVGMPQGPFNNSATK